MGMPLEIYSSVWKSKKENQECTSGDYYTHTHTHTHTPALFYLSQKRQGLQNYDNIVFLLILRNDDSEYFCVLETLIALSI